MNELDYNSDHITALTSLRGHLKDAHDQAQTLGLESTAYDLAGKVDAIDYILGMIEDQMIEEENMWMSERHGY